MLPYIARRILQGAIVIVLISVGTFVVIRLMPATRLTCSSAKARSASAKNRCRRSAPAGDWIAPIMNNI